MADISFTVNGQIPNYTFTVGEGEETTTLGYGDYFVCSQADWDKKYADRVVKIGGVPYRAFVIQDAPPPPPPPIYPEWATAGTASAAIIESEPFEDEEADEFAGFDTEFVETEELEE